MEEKLIDKYSCLYSINKISEIKSMIILFVKFCCLFNWLINLLKSFGFWGIIESFLGFIFLK